MNQLRKILILIMAWSSQSFQAREIGKYDTGDYCNHEIDSKSCFRTVESAIKSGSSCDEGPVEIFEYTDWTDKKMDFASVRDAFVILKSQVHNHPFIYFDSAATAQMPQPVLDAIVDYYQNYKSNVGRGMYVFAEQSTAMFEQARAKIAQFIGAKKREIIFTAGATAGINLIVDLWAEHHILAGDEIVVSEAEHNANFIPWQQLARRKGAILHIVPVTQDGKVNLEVLQSVISEKVKIVAITHQSNVLGTVNDIVAIAEIAHAVGAKVVIDAAQSVAHQKIDVVDNNCDFLVFSGHKLYGPTGVGVLFIKEELFEHCVKHHFGGGIVYGVTADHADFKEMPYCLEPGTPAIASVIGLGAAVDFVQNNIDFEQVREHETELVRHLAQALENIAGITLVSPVPAQGDHNNIVTFCSDRYHAYDLAEYLDECGIAIRAGYHCAQLYYGNHATDAAVRVSFAAYNTMQEVDVLIESLKKLLQ